MVDLRGRTGSLGVVERVLYLQRVALERATTRIKRLRTRGVVIIIL